MKIQAILGEVRSLRTEFSKMYNAIKDDAKTEELGREVYLRPSSLPVCSVTLLDSMISFALEEKSEWDYGADFFTGVGTQVHETIERWCAHSGYKLWGHWDCPNEDCKHHWEYTHENVCPKCGTLAHYHEIEIEYLGWKGHIDCILLTPLGVLIGDYKTCTMWKLGKTRFSDLNVAYALQILAYTYMVWKVHGKYFKEVYNLGIRGCSLLFISRDNPFKDREWHWRFTDRMKSVAQGILYLGRIQIAAAARYFNGEGSLDRVIARRSCKDRRDYYNRVGKFHCYEPCYMQDVCFAHDKKATEKYFKKRMRKLNRKTK